MFDEFTNFQDWAGRGVESLVAVIRIVFAILRRPKRLLAAIFAFAIFGAVVSLHYGWLIPIALVLVAVIVLMLR
jgi:hypothetical protein